MAVDDELLGYDNTAKTVQMVEDVISSYADTRENGKVLVWQHDGCIFEPWNDSKVLAIRIVARLRKEGKCS